MNQIQNRVQLIGNAGADPLIKTTENGKKIAKIQIAINEKHTSASGEKIEKTTWVNCTAFGSLAEIVEKIVSKGTKLLIDGRLSINNQTLENGEKRTYTEILINEVIVIQNQPKNENS